MCQIATKWQRDNRFQFIKGEYLKLFGFQLGDKVKVEISENKIVLSKVDDVSE